MENNLRLLDIEKDLEYLYKWFNDNDIQKYWHLNKFNSIADFKDFLIKRQQYYINYVYLLNNNPICLISINNQIIPIISYTCQKEYRNKGYMYKGLVTFINYLNIDKFDLYINESNTASIKLAQKIGCRYLRQSSYTTQIWRYVKNS